MINQRNTVDHQIVSKINGHKRGWVFTPDHFKHLGSRDSIASALKRHKQSGMIRRLAQGLYDYPKSDPELGVMEPSVDEVAAALADRDAARLQPSGAHAANLLGLSTQVPMKVVYLTDGRSRTVNIGSREIHLKQTTPRNMATANKTSGLIIQALRYLGRDRVDEKIIQTLKGNLSKDERRKLMKDIRYCPAWIADIFRELSQDENQG